MFHAESAKCLSADSGGSHSFLRSHFHFYLLTTKGRQSLITLCAYDIVFKTTALKKQPARLFRMQNGEENTYRVVLKTKRRKTTEEKQTKQHKNKKTPNTHQKHSHKFRGENPDRWQRNSWTLYEGRGGKRISSQKDSRPTAHTASIYIFIYRYIIYMFSFANSVSPD